MLTPIAFSDEQLDAIMHAAQPLAPADRERFVETVIAALQGRELRDGTVYLAIRKAQRQFFAPPGAQSPPMWRHEPGNEGSVKPNCQFSIVVSGGARSSR